MIDRRVLQRVSGRVASRLWDACLPLTLKKRRGMDEISFKEAAGEAGYLLLKHTTNGFPASFVI